MNINDNNISNYKPLEKYLGNDGYKELQELFLYYSNKIKSQFLHINLDINLDINFHKKVINQMKENICEIKKEKEKGTGFFCKIPFPDTNNMLRVLITNNHIINEKILYKKDEKISITIKNEKEKLLNLNNRIKYTNSFEYDTTIIEIKEEDEIQNYLELDNNILNDIINNKNEIEDYEREGIYILQYFGGNLSVSYGNIKGVDRSRFNYNCNTNIGGSPILELNNKVLGIHCGKLENFDLSYGTLLNYPIKEFIQQKYYKDNAHKDISTKKIKLSIQEKLMEKFNLIKKYLGKEIFMELHEFYLSHKISFNLRNSKVVLDSSKTIINQIEKYIFKIKVGNKESIGYFCKIPFPNKNNLLSVFITDNNILNEEILNKKDDNIMIYNGEKKIKEISFSNRRIYTSREFNTTIIEIKEDDEIKNYIELDDNIIEGIVNDEKKENPIIENYFVDNPIYKINNQFGLLTVTYSTIHAIYEDTKSNFLYYYNKKDEPKEGPIFSANNLKIVGQGKDHSFRSCNTGTFLYYPIKEFIQKFKR